MDFSSVDCDIYLKDRNMLSVESNKSVSTSSTPQISTLSLRTVMDPNRKMNISIEQCEIMLGVTRFVLETKIDGIEKAYECVRKETDIMWLYEYLNNNYPNSYYVLPPRPCFLSCENTVAKMIEIEQKLVDLPNLPKKCHFHKKTLHHKLVRRNGAVLINFLDILIADPHYNDDRVLKALFTEREMAVERDLLSFFKNGFKRYIKKDAKLNPSLELYEYFKTKHDVTQKAVSVMEQAVARVTEVVSISSDFYVRFLFLSFFMNDEELMKSFSNKAISVLKEGITYITGWQNFMDTQYFGCIYLTICSLYGTIYSIDLLIKKRDRLAGELMKAEKNNKRGLDSTAGMNAGSGGIESLKENFHNFSTNAEEEIKKAEVQCVKNIINVMKSSTESIQTNYARFESRFMEEIENLRKFDDFELEMPSDCHVNQKIPSV